MMYTVFKFAYQLWRTMTKEDVAFEVKRGSLTKEQYYEIVGEEYPDSVTNK